MSDLNRDYAMSIKATNTDTGKSFCNIPLTVRVHNVPPKSVPTL